MAARAKRNRPSPLHPALAAALLLAALLVSVPPSRAAAPCCGSSALRSLSFRLIQPGGLPAEYRPGVLLLRDDSEETLHSTLIELCRRAGGRGMLRSLVDSGFITVLVSERLRPLQAGLWGPIFREGQVVGAALRIDLMQIRGLDHDPSGVETLAHEMRHQVDAARAFRNAGTYATVYRAAASGDRTRSAQRYASRVRHQRPDISAAEAERWLRPLVARLPEIGGGLVASSSVRSPAGAAGAESPQLER